MFHVKQLENFKESEKMIIQTYDYVELRVDKGASKEKQLSDLTIGLTMIYLSIAKILVKEAHSMLWIYPLKLLRQN